MADNRSGKLGPKIRQKNGTRRDREDAQRLQRAGTMGDTVLAHINPQEASLLDVLADGLADGGGRNPTTGLLSFGNTDGESGRSGGDANPGGVGGGPAGGNTGGGLGGNTAGGMGGLGGGYDGSTVDGFGNFTGPANRGQLGYRTYDPTRTRIESLLAAPNFREPGVNLGRYDQRDTFGRLVQEYRRPSIAPPGRLSPPNRHGPGIMGSFVSQVAGGPFGLAMGIGGAMGRASSPETQAASAAEDAARSATNSTGVERDITGLSLAELLERQPGVRSGAETADEPPPGYTRNPAGQIVPLLTGGGGNSGLGKPVQNLIYDYIWRGW
jgi:hypothetical protein